MARIRTVLDIIILLIFNGFLCFRFPILFGRTAFRLRRWPNAVVPRSFREKRLWRLIFDHDPLFLLFGDKLAAKAWMAGRAPHLHVAPTLWVADSLAEVRTQDLAAGMVVKLNRGCARNIFLDGDGVDRAGIEAQLRDWLGRSFFLPPGLQPSPRISQKLFAERIIASDRQSVLDLNMYCCDGEVLFVVATIGEKTQNERIAYYTPDGCRIGGVEREDGYSRSWLPPEFRLPDCFGAAIRAAEALSAGIDFVRVDLMCAEERLYAGEMTPYPGLGPYMETAFVEQRLRAWDLRKSWFMQTRQSGWKRIYQQALGRHLARRAAAMAAGSRVP